MISDMVTVWKIALENDFIKSKHVVLKLSFFHLVVVTDKHWMCCKLRLGGAADWSIFADNVQHKTYKLEKTCLKPTRIFLDRSIESVEVSWVRKAHYAIKNTYVSDKSKNHICVWLAMSSLLWHTADDDVNVGNSDECESRRPLCRHERNGAWPSTEVRSIKRTACLAGCIRGSLLCV
jgi:hypothetical protein